MFAHNFDARDGALPEIRRVALELTVNNHPGVMSQICGLFARRQYNVEGIVCMPIGRGEHSHVWMLVDEEQRLDQLVKQVRKLRDVLDIRQREPGHPVFAFADKLFQSNALCGE